MGSAIKYMMRIAEILENITSQGSLSPAEYMPIAQQRDAERKQKAQAARLERQIKQQALQQQVWSKSRAVKPPKWRMKRRRSTKRRAEAD